MTVQYLYDESGAFVGTYQGEVKKENSTFLAPPSSVESYRFDGVSWIKKSKIISVTAFMLLWTSKERVTLKQSRAADPVIDDFFDILDGAETVDLALNSTQQGVEYCLTYLGGLDGDILAGVSVADRKAQILSGNVL